MHCQSPANRCAEALHPVSFGRSVIFCFIDRLLLQHDHPGECEPDAWQRRMRMSMHPQPAETEIRPINRQPLKRGCLPAFHRG
jgi:hypothetical protein